MPKSQPNAPVTKHDNRPVKSAARPDSKSKQMREEMQKGIKKRKKSRKKWNKDFGVVIAGFPEDDK